MNYWGGGGGGAKTYFMAPTSPSLSEVIQTSIRLFGSHDKPLTRQ